MGEDVEEAAHRRLAEPLEVAPPDAVGRLAGRPHVVLVVVDGACRRGSAPSRRRSRSRAPSSSVGHPVLAARDEVGLDPEPQVGLLAHERAVVVEVVERAVAPELVVPDVERLREAVDVLGDAELGDAALGGRLAVALGVRRA